MVLLSDQYYSKLTVGKEYFNEEKHFPQSHGTYSRVWDVAINHQVTQISVQVCIFWKKVTQFNEKKSNKGAGKFSLRKQNLSELED